MKQTTNMNIINYQLLKIVKVLQITKENTYAIILYYFLRQQKNKLIFFERD